jgi:hypothetical protein
VEITKLEFLRANKVTRDKVRCPERSYMAAGATVHPSSETPSVILCAQGSLHEAAGLVSIEARRPHKSRTILNNFHGKPFNSPCEVVSNPMDNAVYFTVSTWPVFPHCSELEQRLPFSPCSAPRLSGAGASGNHLHHVDSILHCDRTLLGKPLTAPTGSRVRLRAWLPAGAGTTFWPYLPLPSGDR